MDSNHMESEKPLYSHPIPPASKVVDLIPIKKSRNKFFKILVLILFLLLSIILSINAYLYFFRVNKLIEHNLVINDILDNTITSEDAEAKNLVNVPKTPIPRESLVRMSLLDNELRIPYINTTLNSVLSLEVTEDGSIRNTKNIDLSKNINIIFISKETINSFNLTANDLSNNIAEIIKENNLSVIELDVSLSYLKGYTTLISELKRAVGNDVKLGIYLYPKWGDSIDYSNYVTISNKFHLSDSYKKVASYVDWVKIIAYDYTGPFDILPGPITPKEWFKRTVQYLLKIGIDRNKIIMGINTSAYQWPKREIAYSPIDNYSSPDPQVDIINRQEFEDFIVGDVLKTVKDNKIWENIYSYKKDNKEYITLMASNEQIYELEGIAAEYGLKGIYYR